MTFNCIKNVKSQDEELLLSTLGGIVSQVNMGTAPVRSRKYPKVGVWH